MSDKLNAVDWGGLAGTLIGGASTVIASGNAKSAAQAAADAQKAQSADSVQVALANERAAQALAANKTTSTGLSGGAIAGIAIASVLFLGGLVFVIAKK